MSLKDLVQTFLLNKRQVAKLAGLSYSWLNKTLGSHPNSKTGVEAKLGAEGKEKLVAGLSQHIVELCKALETFEKEGE